MSSRGLANFVIGAGSGYLGAKNDLRRQEREDERDRQNREIQTERLRGERARNDEIEQRRVDNISLRTAAQPIAPTEDGAGGFLRPETMDNRDVGLPENESQPAGGLGLSSYKVGGKSYSSRTEADAAASKENTPAATASRVSKAQLGLGDIKGAQKTQDDARAAAADTMMRDIGGSLVKGWGDFTTTLSSSNGDQNDYRHEKDPATGKINLIATRRSDGKSALAGSYSDDDNGKLDAYKMVGSVVAGKPEMALQHIENRQKAAASLRKEERDERRVAAIEDRVANQGDYWASRAAAGSGGRSGSAPEDRTRRDDAKDRDLEIKATREKRLAVEKQIEQTLKQVDNRMMSKDEGKAEIARLKAIDFQLQKDEKAAPAASASGLNAPSSQAARDSDRMSILQSELAQAKKEGNQGDISALEREIGRGGGKPAAQPAARPAAVKPAAPKPGTVQGGYRFKGGNPADKANWEKE